MVSHLRPAALPLDVETGLADYGFRDYAPALARFTTVDPIRDGRNWFAYVEGDPVNRVDLWGLAASDIAVAPRPSGIAWPLGSGDPSLFPPSFDDLYGPRDPPVPGASAFHSGYDFPAPEGTRVNTILHGRVAFIGDSPGFGTYVEVTHPGGMLTLYAHLSSASVSVGHDLVTGQKIGEVGDTGISTGPHLHFAVDLSGLVDTPGVTRWDNPGRVIIGR